MAHPPKDRRCATCRHWLGQPASGTGQCRALPPAPLLALQLPHYGRGHGALQATWPITCTNDWCGAWQALEEEAGTVRIPLDLIPPLIGEEEPKGHA